MLPDSGVGPKRIVVNIVIDQELGRTKISDS